MATEGKVKFALSLRQSVGESCRRELATRRALGPAPSFPGGTKRKDQKGDDKPMSANAPGLFGGALTRTGQHGSRSP